MNWFLALLGKCFIAGVQALPIEVVARIGRAGGLIAWWVDARHRRVTLENLERVFGREWDAQRRRAVGRENFQRLGEGYLCGLKTPRLSTEEMRERLTIEGFLEALPEGGGSAVFAIGHFGNFEIFTRVKELAPEWTVATTYRALRQPALNALFQSVRAISGVRFFERRSEARILRQTIEGGHVVLTCDLDFGTILAVTHGDKPSVVQLRSDSLSHEDIGVQVVGALRQMEDELARGALVTVEPERTRLRVLTLPIEGS